MSWDIQKLVMESEGILDPAEKYILIYIAINVNENEGNVAWCTQASIAKKTGYHESTVKRRCNSLNKKGILTWIKRKRDKGIFKRNHYTIHCNVLKEMIKNKGVSERTTPMVHTATKVGITESDNNLTNNLTNKINIINQKPSHKPKHNLEHNLNHNLNTPLDETPIPIPITNKLTEVSYSSYFLKFWESIPNKVSKGIAEKNYLKLEQEWINKPEELAKMYKSYYDAVEDKQFAKQPAFWLSAKKYLDEKPKKQNTDLADPYVSRLNMFKEAIEAKKGNSFIKGYAQRHPSDVERAIGEGRFTKQQAIEYLDFRG
jgi:DNA-binding transcriptional regulator YhcF (GntR family)